MDERFALLADRLRRDTVRYLCPSEGEWVDREELVVSLSRRRGSPDRRCIDLQLHHVHLPRLEDAGVLDYDRDAARVRYLGDEELERLVRSADR